MSTDGLFLDPATIEAALVEGSPGMEAYQAPVGPPHSWLRDIHWGADDRRDGYELRCTKCGRKHLFRQIEQDREVMMADRSWCRGKR